MFLQNYLTRRGLNLCNGEAWVIQLMAKCSRDNWSFNTSETVKHGINDVYMKLHSLYGAPSIDGLNMGHSTLWHSMIKHNFISRKYPFTTFYFLPLYSTCTCELMMSPLQWRHNGRDSVSNHQPHDCLLKRLFRRRSKKTSKLRAAGLCAWKSPETGEFPAQMASNAENVSIWWRHHVAIWGITM